MTTEASRIKKLRRVIPEVTGCIPGCNACCGPVPFSKWEWEHLRDKRFLIGHDKMCPYVEDGRCAIYSERPILCRLFATVSETGFLVCPKGAKVIPQSKSYSPNEVGAQYLEILSETGEHGPFTDLMTAITQTVPALRMVVTQ